MKPFFQALAVVLALSFSAGTTAQQTSAPPRFEGTAVLMTGSAELQVENDEAWVSFYLELQDADPARVQSQLNQKVADAVASIKRADAKAQVETAGYSSYPVYAPGGGRKITGWRARQSVNVRSTDLVALPRLVAAGQQTLALGGIDFRLSRAARERVETELIQRAIANLNARVNAAAQALNVPASRVRMEEINFGVGAGERPPMLAMARAQPMAAESVAEPQFDAGRSTQQLSVSARVRFLSPTGQ